jgi:uncharacterized coiled-coil protein SlyX
MTSKEMERAIEFLLGHNAKVSADIEGLTDRIGRLAEAQTKTTDDLQILTGKVLELTDGAINTQSRLDSVIEEMREGFNNLIVANEVTRKLAEDVARLGIKTSQRVTHLESRVDDLEQKRQ